MYGRTLLGYVLYFLRTEYRRQAKYLDRDICAGKQMLYRHESS